MFDELFMILKAVEENDELFTRLAKIIRKAVDALVAEGFSRDEAMALLSNFKPKNK